MKSLHYPKCLFMTQNVPACPQMVLKHFSGAKYMIIWHIGPPWGLFRVPHCPSGPLKGPRVVQHDTISCNIPIGSVLGPFGVIQGHFGSRRAIFGHEGPFLVLFWAIMGPPWASEKGPGWSNMTYNHVIYPLEVF